MNHLKEKPGVSEIEFQELKLKYENLKSENNALIQKNERLSNWQVFFTEAPLAMAKYDYLKGHYYPNKALCQILGLKNSEIEKISPKGLFKNDETANQILDKMISNEFFSGEIEMLKNNGESFVGTLNVNPIKMANDEIVAIVSVQQDYTQNKLLEAQKELHFQYLQTLQSITMGMIRRLNLTNLLNVIIAKASTISQVPNGFIFLYDSTKENLILKGCGKYKEDIGCAFSPREGFIGGSF